MTKVANRIPTVDDKIFAIKSSVITSKVPDFLSNENKPHFITGLFFQKVSSTVESVTRHQDPNYVLVETTTGEKLDFPRHIDNPEKQKDRFYSSEDDCDKEIEARTMQEIIRIEAMVQHYQENEIAFLKNILRDKTY